MLKPFLRGLKIAFIGLLLSGLDTPPPTDDCLRSLKYNPASQVFYDQKLKQNLLKCVQISKTLAK